VILETSLVASLKDYGEFTLKACFNNSNDVGLLILVRRLISKKKFIR
tara:strand:- start:34 stop:174 length:141 start_codon:yes stop_codon:yes gene_type:complete